MAYGDIGSILDGPDLIAVAGYEVQIARVSDTIVLVGYVDAFGSGNLQLLTYSVAADGTLTATGYTASFAAQSNPFSFLNLTGEQWSVAYCGDLAAGYDGFTKTMTIDASTGKITLSGQTWEHGDAITATKGNTLYRPATDMYMVVYASGAGGGGVLTAKTFTVDGAGAITATGQSLTIETPHGIFPRLCAISGNVHGVFYRYYTGTGWGARMKTLSVNPSTGAMSLINSYNIDTTDSAGVSPITPIEITDNVFAVVYNSSGAPPPGVIEVLSISNDGNTISTIDTQNPVTSTGSTMNPVTSVDVGSNVIAIFSRTFGASQGLLSTHSISDSGTIDTSRIDYLEMGGGSLDYYLSITYVSGENYAAIYSTFPAYAINIFTVNIETPVPPVINSISPSSGILGRTVDVTITGQYFTGTTIVSFGAGIDVDSFTVDSDTQISAVLEIASDADGGNRDVSVTTNGGSDILSNGFTVLTQEDHYSMQISNLRIPYIDLDGGKQLHVVLENLSPTTKTEGEDGEVVIDIGYEVAG